MKNLPKDKDTIADLKRYEEHLETLYRAKEIIATEEDPIIQSAMLHEINCDRVTYGEWEHRDGRELFRPIVSKATHIWSLDKEIESFKYAIKLLKTEGY